MGLQEGLNRQSDIGALVRSVMAVNGMGQHYTDANHPVVRLAVELARAKHARQVLEFGTGRGLVAKALALETGAQVTATDINRIGLQELAQTASDMELLIETRELDAAKPLPKDLHGKADLVIAKDVLPFLPTNAVRIFMQNINNALIPNGRAIFTGPSVNSRLFQEAEIFHNPNGDFSRLLSQNAQDFIQTTVPHFNFTDPWHMEAISSENGLTLVSIEAFGRERGWLCAVVEKR